MAFGMIQNGKFVHDLFQKEKYAFEHLIKTTKKQVVYLTGSPLEKKCFKTLKESNGWLDNSENTSNPPDYINSEKKLMLEFMSVNDYEKTKPGGSPDNPPAREGAFSAKEIIKSSITNQFPAVTNIMFEYEDKMEPDYDQYYQNFCRVIDSHKNKISYYKKNHPECDHLAFVVCDISEHEHFRVINKNGKTSKALHHPCYDIDFLKKIKQCGADFVLWFSPYISPPFGKTPRLIIIEVASLCPEKANFYASAQRA
ncbi:MAG: hypothetical protein IJR89_00770 [Clostridia bacterium]|nr:hypothetical protein [Clostridia bacterium]